MRCGCRIDDGREGIVKYMSSEEEITLPGGDHGESVEQ